jgi:hypothetical protein
VKSYLPYVNGQDQAGGKWVYVMRASAFLDDAFGTLLRNVRSTAGLSPREKTRAWRVGSRSQRLSKGCWPLKRPGQHSGSGRAHR